MFILGKKLNMTQIWQDNNIIPVTKIQAGPCAVTQIKVAKKDGYNAIQIGFGEKKTKNFIFHSRATAEDEQKLKIKNYLQYREFRIKINSDNNNKLDFKVGDIINVSAFKIGDVVKVTGISKGKGFQGVVKRHKFAGAPATHGTKDQLRMPGSIGATGPAHVFKGRKMPGRMGGDKVTVANLKIIEVDKEKNILFIKGAVPGARNGLVCIMHNA